jgi:hypothetical protein
MKPQNKRLADQPLRHNRSILVLGPNPEPLRGAAAFWLELPAASDPPHSVGMGTVRRAPGLRGVPMHCTPRAPRPKAGAGLCGPCVRRRARRIRPLQGQQE